MDPKKFNSSKPSARTPMRGDVYYVNDCSKVRPAVIVDCRASDVRVLFCTSKSHSEFSQYEIQDTLSAGLDGISFVIRELRKVRFSDLKAYRGRLSGSDLKRLNIPAILQSTGGAVLKSNTGNGIYSGDYQDRLRNRYE